MKIQVIDTDDEMVFSFDVKTGKATISSKVTMDTVATEFVRAVESALTVALSQFEPDKTIKDVLLHMGRGEGGGNFNIRMGDGPEETAHDNPQGVSVKNAESKP